MENAVGKSLTQDFAKQKNGKRLIFFLDKKSNLDDRSNRQ